MQNQIGGSHIPTTSLGETFQIYRVCISACRFSINHSLCRIQSELDHIPITSLGESFASTGWRCCSLFRPLEEVVELLRRIPSKVLPACGSDPQAMRTHEIWCVMQPAPKFLFVVSQGDFDTPRSFLWFHVSQIWLPIDSLPRRHGLICRCCTVHERLGAPSPSPAAVHGKKKRNKSATTLNSCQRRISFSF